jgi:hypothetical protein
LALDFSQKQAGMARGPPSFIKTKHLAGGPGSRPSLDANLCRRRTDRTSDVVAPNTAWMIDPLPTVVSTPFVGSTWYKVLLDLTDIFCTRVDLTGNDMRLVIEEWEELREIRGRKRVFAFYSPINGLNP